MPEHDIVIKGRATEIPVLPVGGRGVSVALRARTAGAYDQNGAVAHVNAARRLGAGDPVDLIGVLQNGQTPVEAVDQAGAARAGEE